MNFDIGLEPIISAKMLIALIFGAIIGLDRERHGREAGIRTYAAVAVGATPFTSIAAHVVGDPAAASRIVANIITGVSFLGAGIIYRDGGRSRGLTTAATIWGTAAMGVAIGMNMSVVATGATAILFGLISLHYQAWYVNWKLRLAKKHSNEIAKWRSRILSSLT